MQHLITKADILQYEEFSANIEDRVIEPRINDAHTYDLPNVLAPDVLRMVYEATTDPVPWDNTTAYTVGSVVVSEGLVYDAVLGNSGIRPSPTTPEWSLNKGATLRYSLLPPFLVWSTLRRFYLRIGRNIAPSGIITPTDPQGSFQPITDKGRGEIMADATNKAEFHRQNVLTFLGNNDLKNTGDCSRGYYGPTRSRVWGV